MTSKREQMTADEIRNSNSLEAQMAARAVAEGAPLSSFNSDWQQDFKQLVAAVQSIDSSLKVLARLKWRQP